MVREYGKSDAIGSIMADMLDAHDAQEFDLEERLRLRLNWFKNGFKGREPKITRKLTPAYRRVFGSMPV